MRNKHFHEPVIQQQVQVLNKLIFNQTRTPLWFGYNRQANRLRRPFVYFPRIHGEKADKFLQLNPHLNQCCSQGQSLDGQKRFDIIFDLAELTQVARLDRESFQPYFEYVKAVLGLYEQLCQGRNLNSVQAMRENLGISNNLILTVCESEAKEQLVIHETLKDGFLRLAKSLFYNYLPFNKWVGPNYPNNRVMCYLWDSLTDAQPHQTVYGWEKFKYGQDRGSGHGIEEEECIDTNRKLREILLDYFAAPNMRVSELMYGSEGKTYKYDQLGPLLQQIIDRFTTVYAVFKAECADAHFSYKVIDAVT